MGIFERNETLCWRLSAVRKWIGSMQFTLSNVTYLGTTGIQVGRVAVSGNVFSEGTTGRSIDASGYTILPGLIDLHGDGFEHHMAPRRGAVKDLARGLRATCSELAVNGITTAVMAQFYSWEGGMRGPHFASEVFAQLRNKRAHTPVDIIPQLRFEYLMREDWERVGAMIREFDIPYVVLNDHVPHEALAKGKKPPRLTGQALKAKRSPEAHLALLQQMHEGQEAALHDLPNWIAQFPNVLFASHDDATKSQRQQFSQMGVKIAEFPETEAAAGAAIDLGEAVILGAPNVMRGSSHKGNVSARDLVTQNLCTALASDYHYPSMLQAALQLSTETGFEYAWPLVSSNPASVLGLNDRGSVSAGQRADFIVLNADIQLEATFSNGRPVYLTGEFAARLLA
jgi:alpha-D-ribose 1-methylphosphonate 5-triphosphate diphosphatase